jgi:hypothetical protein
MPAAESSPPAAASTTGEAAQDGARDGTRGGSQGNSDRASAALPASLSLLPVMAFFFGFYPKRATLAIERIALRIMKGIVSDDSYRALPLSMLAGMSYTHELRLEREGFDNIENLSNADAVDLAVRTCFSYGQLKQWIDQAWLATHLREDYPDFVRRTGIASSDELRHFLASCDAAKVDGVEQLVAGLSTDPATGPSWKVRLAAIKILLDIDPALPANRSNPDTGEHGSG